MSYTKLFSEIVMSTIWREPNHVRILWITMLALRNQYHIVEASIPGLADAARITLDECQEGLGILTSPDTFSRSQDFEGRRIEVCDGGWFILNGEKYRKKMNAEDRRRYKTEKQREYRAKEKGVDNPVDPSRQSRQSGHSRVEQSREENIKEEEHTAPSGPVVPHVKILNLYHEHCPDLPRIKVWEGQRKENLRQRFKGWDNLEWWEWFFKRIHELDFYNGRLEGKTWRANLDWIVKLSNFQKMVDICHEQVNEEI